MQKNTIRILVGAVIVVLIGFLLFVRRADAPRVVLDEKTTATTTSATSTAGYSVQIVPKVSTQPIIKKAPPLERPITFSAIFDASAQEAVKKGFASIQEIIKKDPHSVEGWIRLGLQRKIVDDYEGARDAWEYAEYLAPTNIVTPNNLGDLYHYYLKDYVKSEAEFKKAIVNNPTYILSYKNLSDLYLYSYQTTTTKAVDILIAGLAKNPKSTDLMLLVAGYYKQKGNISEARKYFTQALNELKAIGANPVAIQQEIDNLK